MDETTNPVPTPAEASAPPKIVNFDAGETFDGETITLDRPFQLGGVAYTAVKLRVPTGADYERYTKEGVKIDTFGLLTAFSGLSVEVLHRMASSDMKKLDFALGKLLWG
jgi:hypothetical protein